MPVNEKLKRCLDEGSRGGERHQGLRRIKPVAGGVQGHLEKAAHNLEAMTIFHDMQYSDWSASAAFYALYHGLLAILARSHSSRISSAREKSSALAKRISKRSSIETLLSISSTATRSLTCGNACNTRPGRLLPRRNSKSSRKGPKACSTKSASRLNGLLSARASSDRANPANATDIERASIDCLWTNIER